MKFITGLVTGIALGAAGAVYYSVKSGKDLRATYDEVRAEIDARNYDALGARIERGFADLQTEIEERMSQVRAGASTALDEVDDVTDEVASQLDEGDPDDLGADADAIVENATDAIDSVDDAVADGANAVAEAADAATDSADAWNRERS